MNFVDEIQLEAAAGDGGNGVVRWHNSRNNPRGGPAGGNGGHGGNIRIRAVRDISLLGKYRGNTFFKAAHGGDGGKSSLHGGDGGDVIIDLPIGAIVRLNKKQKTFELLKEGEEFVVLKGGIGGFGNEHFKSSRNVSPKEKTDGRKGEKDTLDIELRLIADLGLVGFPNAGKTSLLNAVTNTKAKVGSYEFTTLDPNLGTLFGYIIADIPGIIEGASEGRGLGHKFLRHVSRTKALIFCISVEQDDPIDAFNTLLGELTKFDLKLEKTPFIVVLTKTDLIESDQVAVLEEKLTAISNNVYSVSVFDEESLKNLTDGITSFLRSLE